jgi:homoserine O-acetyltransferase/O-succinyltransferase
MTPRISPRRCASANGLEKIGVPLVVAINSADDLLNPPEFGILEREIKRGHGSHTLARLWLQGLQKLLARTEHP